jgi:drug/metabolite transporter (DMT)-like permease
MNQRNLVDLLLLGALWGASFLFMRMGAAEFGPAPLVFLRVAGASLCLLPLLALRGETAALRQHWRAIAVVGVLNSAIPFMLFMVAALVLSAGLMSVFNATTPIWGALVGWVWLRDKPAPQRLFGLAIGLAGVVGLSWGKADFKAGALGVSPAMGIGACVAAAMLYGVAGHLSRRTLTGVPPLAVATGTQISAALVLVLPAWWAWPAALPSAQSWWAAAALAVGCTGLAYVLYFRLMANAGATVAMSVTFLIPAYAMLWGWWFLGEQPTATMLMGGAVILLGTALATGLVKWPVKRTDEADQ